MLLPLLAALLTACGQTTENNQSTTDSSAAPSAPTTAKVSKAEPPPTKATDVPAEKSKPVANPGSVFEGTANETAWAVDSVVAFSELEERIAGKVETIYLYFRVGQVLKGKNSELILRMSLMEPFTGTLPATYTLSPGSFGAPVRADAGGAVKANGENTRWFTQADKSDRSTDWLDRAFSNEQSGTFTLTALDRSARTLSGAFDLRLEETKLYDESNYKPAVVRLKGQFKDVKY